MRRTIISCLVAAGCYVSAMLQPALAQEARVPAGYPAEYASLIAAAEKEGKVLVYGNLPLAAWQPLLTEFKKRYPKIAVETLDLGDELFERYLAESAAGSETGDIIVSSAINKWLEFTQRKEIAEYETPEASAIPQWARPLPGVYVLSADPYLIAYNKALLPEGRYPKSMADVVALVKELPDLQGRLSTFDAARGATGHGVWAAWMRDNGEKGWAMLDAIGPAIRPETGVGTMMDKLLAGEYAIGFFASASGVIRILGSPGAEQISGYGLIEDGTPIMLRGGAVTKGAKHPNAARLFMDFVLSRDGQLLLAQANLTPYRPDIKPSEVKHFTFGGMAEKIGEKNLNIVRYDQKMLDEHAAFVDRWSKAIRGGK
jgi:iron(III) transport system substrate-binding protein